MIDRLPAHLAIKFEHFLDLDRDELALIERIFRSVIGLDEGGFRQGLAELHPGIEGGNPFWNCSDGKTESKKQEFTPMGTFVLKQKC